MTVEAHSVSKRRQSLPRIPRSEEPCTHCGVGRSILHEGVGEMLKRRRAKSGLSFRELARLTGLSPTYLCDLEHNRRTWTPDLFVRVLYAATFRESTRPTLPACDRSGE